MKSTGKIIPLAFPDTFVKLSDEKRLKVFYYLGIGTKTHIKAGHASMVLVNGKTGELHYFDFGRYITPDGYGRCRDKETDAELDIPITAEFDNQGAILNLDDILIWLQTNPKKTHGEGRMIASVGDINFDIAYNYAKSIQQMGSVPYKAFGAGTKDGFGTNCSRLVTQTILKGISDKTIQKKLKFNKRFTPSPLGNVEITANGTTIYNVLNGDVYIYNSTAFRENLVNFFDKKNIESTVDKTKKQPANTTFLSGIGSSAYFRIEQADEDNVYKMTRFNDLAEQDFSGLFTCESGGFNINKNYKFVYESHCLYFHIEQNGERYKFVRKN